MKKMLVVFALLMFCSIPIGLFAESDAVDQGSIEFGLGTAFNLTMYSGNLEASEVVIGSGSTLLNFGYFIIDNLSVGGSFYFFRWKYEGAPESSTEFFIGPEIKYYFPVSDQVLANLRGRFQLVSWKDPLDIDRSSRIWFGGGGALTYFLQSNLGVYGGADILFSPNYKDQGTTIDDTSYTLIDFSVGFRIYL